MKRKLLVLVLLLVSAVSFAQYVVYDDFVWIIKSPSHSDVTRFLTRSGWNYKNSSKDGEITGDPWKTVVYTKNCSINSEGEPRNTASGWGVLYSSKSIRSGKTVSLCYKFGNYNVYSQYMSSAKSNGYRYDAENSSSDGQYVTLRRNKDALTFEKEGNYYCVSYNANYYDY